MKLFHTLPVAALLAGHLAASSPAHARGFSESDAVFYGEVRQSGGGQTVLLQAGRLKLTFVNQANSANRVALETDLRPTGTGSAKRWSYSLKVPMAYLPETPRLHDFLSISTLPTAFKLHEITINGTPATLTDGSREFYGLNFASRATAHRLDLLVAGDSTDTDRDGMIDWWEHLHGLNNTLADGDGDPDADGWTNLDEFLRGSNPRHNNRVPQLVTSEILLPESGEAGLLLHVLDSDTPPAGIDVALAVPADIGFRINLDGTALPPGELRQFSLSALQSGRLTIAHTLRSAREFSLQVSWNDGSGAASGAVLVRVEAPSAIDGSDAALWLDGFDLPPDGAPVGTWSDRSGHGRSAMQPVTAHQPIVTGRGADFSESGSAHLFWQDAALPPGNHTVLAAYEAAGFSDTPQTLLSTNRGFLNLAATTQPVSYPGAATWQLDGAAVRGFANTAGRPAISIFRREDSLLQCIFGFSRDGENINPAEIEPVLPTLGARRAAVPSGANPVDQVFSGRLHELLVFPSALPEQKLRDVHDYLESKWGGAVIWDFSTRFNAITLTATSGTQRRIIRGGFGDDQLTGSAGDDTFSGGGGDDTLTGGGGADRFVFGEVDTGRDRLTDFDHEQDIIDLSALFWGKTGDARQHVMVRLDTNFATPVPTLDSVLIVKLADHTTREIVLVNSVIGGTQLIRLIVEGRLRMGALTIPAAVQFAAASGGPLPALRESRDQSFNVTLLRTGAGVPAALDVPLGFFTGAPGGRFVIDDASSNGGQRAVVSFARGQTSKTVTVHPVPDLETSGQSTAHVSVLPHYKYTVGGAPVEQAVTDHPMVWLEVTRANAVASPPGPAVVRVHRNGALSESMDVGLQAGGTAVEGQHVDDLPDNITIPAGQSFHDIRIAARAAGLTAGPKVLLLRLASSGRCLIGHPHEALLYAGNSFDETNSAGIDRWLLGSTGGAFTSADTLSAAAPQELSRYLTAYGMGLNSVDDAASRGLRIRMAGDRPELLVPHTLSAADIRWSIESSDHLHGWSDAGSTLVSAPHGAGLRFTGPPVRPGDPAKFYRLNFRLDPGRSAAGNISGLTGSNHYGMSGNGTWRTGENGEALVSSGTGAGESSRLISEAAGPLSLDFEMGVANPGPTDSFAFYIDGVLVAATRGEPVRIRQNLSGPASRLLMWEFTRGSGTAMIRNPVP